MKSSEKYADKAEATGNLTMITKSNSLRKTAKQKKEELQVVLEKLEEKSLKS